MGLSRFRGGVIVLPALICALVLFRPAVSQEPASPARFTSDGRLEFPAEYREWIFLSAGRGMTYGPSADPNGPPMFDNVFVDPAAYRYFLKSGHWPEKAVFVLEIRNAASEGSINKGGQFQKGLVRVEVEVKDKRFQATNGWSFYEFGPDRKPAEPFAKSATCYSCHPANGAVEQTFVQFYPTLLPIAEAHGTLRKRD